MGKLTKSGHEGLERSFSYMQDEIRSYNDIYKEFLRMCSCEDNEVCEWHEIDRYSICVVLYSGEVYKYDSLTKSYRHYSNYEDSVAPPKDEREWRTRFSFNLCRMMMKRGWSQKDLAYATGITQSTMCKYMSGEVTPTLYKIMIITEALGCTIDDLAYS